MWMIPKVWCKLYLFSKYRSHELQFCFEGYTISKFYIRWINKRIHVSNWFKSLRHHDCLLRLVRLRHERRHRLFTTSILYGRKHNYASAYEAGPLGTQPSPVGVTGDGWHQHRNITTTLACHNDRWRHQPNNDLLFYGQLCVLETNPDVIVRCCDVMTCLFIELFCIDHSVVFNLWGEFERYCLLICSTFKCFLTSELAFIFCKQLTSWIRHECKQFVNNWA